MELPRFLVPDVYREVGIPYNVCVFVCVCQLFKYTIALNLNYIRFNIVFVAAN